MPLVEVTSSDQLESLTFGPYERVEIVGTLFSYRSGIDSKPSSYGTEKYCGIDLSDLPVWVQVPAELRYHQQDSQQEQSEQIPIGSPVRIHVIVEPVVNNGVRSFSLSALAPLAHPAG